MSTDREEQALDQRLREALRAADPGEPFVRRVMARIGREKAETQILAKPGSARRSWPRRMAWISTALAASLLLALIGHQWQQDREQAEGLEARARLLEALRLTSEKLDLAYDVVNAPDQTNGEDATHES
jgi:hypothetical protein